MNSKVVDNCYCLSNLELSRINTALAIFEQKTKVELCVLIVRTVIGEDAREHARRMRQVMTVSTEASCTVVIAIDDRHAELAIASKFSTDFTPDQTRKLLTNNFVPSMRENRLCEGIVNTVKAMRVSISLDSFSSCRRRNSGPFKKRILVPFMLFVVIVIWQLFGWIQTHRCPKCNKLLSIHSEVLIYSTYSSTGLRETTYDCKHCEHCEHCEHHSSKTDIIPQKVVMNLHAMMIMIMIMNVHHQGVVMIMEVAAVMVVAFDFIF